MILVYGRDEAIAKWVETKLGDGPCPRPAHAIGIVKGDELVGGAVFHSYNGYNIECSAYGPRCMSRPILKAGCTYAFDELKCLRITARTRRSNRLMCKLLPRLGFDYEATIKNYFGPTRADDALLFRLTEEYASKWM